jgi:methionine-R-sulfoxide reductase
LPRIFSNDYSSPKIKIMRFSLFIFSAFLLFVVSSCNSTSVATSTTKDKVIQDTLPTSAIWDGKKITKSEADWQAQLSAQAYEVLRKKGTERSFSSALNENKKAGTYCCAACSLPLFSAKTKFDSGTGWPSFFAPIAPTHVGEIADDEHGMQRVEVVCNRCGGHLGHVFNDGPEPTGLRYCINGVSLAFKAE